MDWICSRDIEENMAELSTWRFQVKTESNFENSNEQVWSFFKITHINIHYRSTSFFIWYYFYLFFKRLKKYIYSTYLFILQAKLDLRINSIISHGTHVLSIYSPFWMINKTGKTLTYKDSQDSQNNILHPYDQKWNEVPMMFSYTKRFLGKRKGKKLWIMP